MPAHGPKLMLVRQRETFDFCASVVEWRQQNWDRGRFPEMREQLKADGSHYRLRRWLGWQWSRLREDPSFGESGWVCPLNASFCGVKCCIWECLTFTLAVIVTRPSEYMLSEDKAMEEGEVVNYDTRLLFGEDISADGADDGTDTDREEDEFFDAPESREMAVETEDGSPGAVVQA